MNKEKKFNIIGFFGNAQERYIPSKTCVIHYGTPLISKRDEPGVLWCPECGMRYSEKDTATTEDIKGKFKGPNQKSQIISAKKKKKYYDKQGNIINDPDLIADIERGGVTVIRYHEEKSGEDEGA
jgi:hypothetical protein